jgi:hypothetical protein
MAYKSFDDSSSTLTADERAAEAKRILERLRPEIMRDVSSWSEQANKFMFEKLDELELVGRVDVTIKQLFWMRDLNGMVD